MSSFFSAFSLEPAWSLSSDLSFLRELSSDSKPRAPISSSSPTEVPVQARGSGDRFCKMARILAHICGLTLSLKRYIGKSPTVQWVHFHMKMQNRIRNGMLLNIFNEAEVNLYSMTLKGLLSICPHQRSIEDLRQIQEHLKKNISFQHLPNDVQLQLCQIVIYQEYETGSVIIKKGHWPKECYLVLSGKLAAVLSLKTENSNSEILSEFEEGDFVGETCLLTNTHRPSTIVCKSDTELLVISKTDFDYILSNIVQEQFQGMCSFIRDRPIFSTWSKEKIAFLVHCSSLRRYRLSFIKFSRLINRRIYGAFNLCHRDTYVLEHDLIKLLCLGFNP